MCQIGTDFRAWAEDPPPSVLIAPLLGVLIVIMANKASLRGELRNKWWHNLFAAIGLIAIIASSMRLITILLG